MSRATDWHPVKLPHLFERQIAFCVPSADRVVVMSYDGLHDVRLGPPVTVVTDETHAEGYDVYDVDRLTLSVGGQTYPALGLHGGCPHPMSHDGLTLSVDATTNRVEVRNAAGELIIVSDHNDYPPGWLCASFSADGRLLVVGTPDDLWCWRRND